MTAAERAASASDQILPIPPQGHISSITLFASIKAISKRLKNCLVSSPKSRLLRPKSRLFTGNVPASPPCTAGLRTGCSVGLLTHALCRIRLLHVLRVAQRTFRAHPFARSLGKGGNHHLQMIEIHADSSLRSGLHCSTSEGWMQKPATPIQMRLPWPSRALAIHPKANGLASNLRPICSTAEPL